jgi:peptide methionine sulfoxide reductase msrA/msrB
MEKKATFAGGCFWCMQAPFDATPGVLSTLVGYTGGRTENPTYEEVCGGDTGHAEAIEVVYDPAKVAYEKLLDVFWRQVDPTTPNRQFADAGTQYRTAVYYHDEQQRSAAEASKKALGQSGRFDQPIVTEIAPAQTFYPAEENHQKYYQKRTLHYEMYKKGSGRQDFIERVWKD